MIVSERVGAEAGVGVSRRRNRYQEDNMQRNPM